VKIRKITGCRWLRRFATVAVTLYPLVLYRDAEPGATLRTHEAIHVAQVRSVGWLRFYAGYVWQYARGRLRGLGHAAAYRAIAYEAEAYAHQHDPGYPRRLIG